MIVVDNSILATVAKCDTRAAVRHVLGLTTPDEHAELNAGKAVHTALAAWAFGVTEPSPLTLLEQEYREWADANVAADHRLAFGNVRNIVADWLETHPVAKFPVRVRHVEVPIQVMLTPDVTFVGVLDALGEDDEGRSWVVEHKTTGRITADWKSQWRLDSQVTGYVWAASAWLGKPVTGAYINGIQLSKLPTSAKKCPKHGVAYYECAPRHAEHEIVPVGRTPAVVDAWRATAMHLAERYRTLKQVVTNVDDVRQVAMQGAFNNSCRWCPFQDFCETGRRQASMLVSSPWSPVEHAKRR